MPQRVKRLIIIIAVSLIAILLAKSLLSRAVKNLNFETQKKQQAKLIKQSSILPASSPTATSESNRIEATSSPATTQNLAERP